MKLVDVSVVIVNWNTRDILRDCLWSVYEQTQDISFEVIVVDNASSDGSAAMVKKEFPQVILIENFKNRGFAAANNQGITIAKGQYVLLLNSDTLILNNAIAKTVIFADNRPETAVIACRVLNPDRTLQRTCFMFPSLLNIVLSSTYLYKLFPRNKFFGRERMTWWNRDDVREMDVTTGCFMLVRRLAIKQVGLLDERFFIYGEETDWCYRFKKAGWKVLFTPTAEIIHLGRASTKQVRLKMVLQYTKSLLIFFRKHYGYAVYFLTRVLLTIQDGVRCASWGMLKLYRDLTGQDTQNEKWRVREYWWSFWFCLLGMGLDKDGLRQFIRKVAITLRDSIEILFAILCRMYSHLFRRLPAKVVLYYHAVKQKDVVGFESQMKYLAKFCHVVGTSDFMTMSQDRKKPVVAVIFDDALVSFRENALPVLHRYGLTVAISVPVGNIGKPPSWLMDSDCNDGDEAVLDAKSIVELDRLGYEVLSHTISHRDLTQLNVAELETELCESRRLLEKMLGHEVNGIVYPYGVCNKTVCEVAERAGYRIGFSVEPQTIRQSTDVLCIGRFNTSPNECMFKFKLKVRGAYKTLRGLRWFKHMLTECCRTQKRVP